MTTRFRVQALSRRGSILSSTSPPPRHRSPLALPQVRRDRSPRPAPSPPKTWVQRRTGSVDTSCTTAASLRHSLLSSKDTPQQGKTPHVPFPGAGSACMEERNAIATPSSVGDPPGLHDLLIDESLSLYIAAELAPGPSQIRKRLQCPTPAPILSVTPDLSENKQAATVIRVINPPPPVKTPRALSRTKAPPNTKIRNLRLPAVTSPLRQQAGSPAPGRNITPTPLRAYTVMRQHDDHNRRKPDRRSPIVQR